MRHVVELRDTRQRETAKHPFFRWLESDSVPLERRFDWAPMAALFIMQFRDMNRSMLRFPEVRSELEWVINRGTIEDETHAALFVDEWRTLGLDDRLGWRASDTLWWLFLSAEQEAYRRVGMKYISMGVEDGDDPLVRFGHSEASEATGHVLFSTSAPLATALGERTGREYRYFGQYHLERESGHVANTEGVFEERELSEAQRENGMRLCSAMFGLFDDVFDGFLDYARRYVETGMVPSRPASTPPSDATIPAPYDGLALDRDPRHARVWRALEARRQQAARHPLYDWLGQDEGRTATQRLCGFIPLWVVDILGYRDLAKYAFTYPDPETDAQRAINRWATELTTHSALFLDDWDSLGLDDILGFNAGDTLGFVFLDPDMDLHREHLIEFAQLAMRHTDPALRWWMMTALESTGEEFFKYTRPLAEAVETTSDVRLNYLAERHNLAGDAGEARPKLPPAPLAPGDEDTAIGLIETVYDAFESQLTRSYCVARADRFEVFDSDRVGAPA